MFFVCRGGADRQKGSMFNKFGGSWRIGTSPARLAGPFRSILYEDISLSVLRASNGPLDSWGEWVVKIEFEDLDYCTQSERSHQ